MDPLSTVASVIALYQLASAVSGLCFCYGEGVRGADRDANLVIDEIDTFLQYLRKIKEILATEDEATDGANRLQNLSAIINDESAALKMCWGYLKDIKESLIKAQSKGRLKGAIHKLSWPLKQEAVRNTVDTLKKFNEAVDRALNVDNNATIRGIDNTTKRIQGSLESAEAHEIREKIMDWLAHPDPSEIHEIVRRDRNEQAKTGRWLLDGNAFELFKTTPRSVLWLHGDSGCGKSVLCSAVIDEILAVQSSDARTELAYWYFSVTDKTRTTVDSFLRALVAQLVLTYPVPRFLLDLWTARKLGREAPNTADLEQTIKKVLGAERSRIYFVVIDAVDESDETERAGFLQFVRSLTLLEADIHILVTSRTNTIGVQKAIKNLDNFYDIAIEEQNTDHDILAHVTERLANDDALRKWSPELRQSIKDTLIKDAGGMFRWVECQLQAVRKCRKPAEVRKTLKTLPKDLHEVYTRELAKIDDSASQDVLRLLEWLAFPQRRLRVEEAIDMLAVDMQSDSPAFDEENRMVDSEELLNMCGSLVRLNKNADGQTDTDDTAKLQTLTAAHTSVIDFLTTQPIKVGSTDSFTFSRAKANLRMAETCLIYLRYFSEKDIVLTEENIANYPFAQQCALIWDILYQEVLALPEQLDMARLNGLVMELFLSPTATLNWLKLNNPDKAELNWLKLIHPEKDGGAFDSDAAMFHVKPAIYYAAHLGFPEIVRSLIHEGKTLDEVVGPPFGTPLVAASAQGRTDVVSLLLDSGANPNLSGYFFYGTPLAAAISFDRYEVVKLLLGREGVKVNGIRHPHLEAMDEVLKRIDEYHYLRGSIGDDGNWHNHESIEFGTELIKLTETANILHYGDEYYDKTHYPKDYLIRADAAWERIERSTEGMVYITAENDKQDILEILLAAGANPNVRGGLYSTALQRACAYDLDVSVKQLLENGAKTDVYGGRFGSPLQAACSHGRIRIVENLISAGADVNRLEHRPGVWSLGSPLATACKAGRLEIARLLVEAGADLHATNLIGNSALLTTVFTRESQLGLFEYLIGQGADPLQGDKRGCNALQYAARAKRSDLIKKISDSGHNVNTTDRNGWSSLHWAVASTEDSTEIVRLLLQSGVDKTVKDKQGRAAADLAKTFKKTQEATILGDIHQAPTESFDHEELRVQSNKYRICDGCEVIRHYCEPESWHRCNDCIDFDFCFRCVLDKDIIHFQDHTFSNEPA